MMKGSELRTETLSLGKICNTDNKKEGVKWHSIHRQSVSSWGESYLKHQKKDEQLILREIMKNTKKKLNGLGQA